MHFIFTFFFLVQYLIQDQTLKLVIIHLYSLLNWKISLVFKKIYFKPLTFSTSTRHLEEYTVFEYGQTNMSLNWICLAFPCD